MKECLEHRKYCRLNGYTHGRFIATNKVRVPELLYQERAQFAKSLRFRVEENLVVVVWIGKNTHRLERLGKISSASNLSKHLLLTLKLKVQRTKNKFFKISFKIFSSVGYKGLLYPYRNNPLSLQGLLTGRLRDGEPSRRVPTLRLPHTRRFALRLEDKKYG